MRFGGTGCFPTDARTRRGASSAPVVMRCSDGDHDAWAFPWRLLGVHSARLDVSHRYLVRDEAPGLICAWVADILITMTEDVGARSSPCWSSVSGSSAH